MTDRKLKKEAMIGSTIFHKGVSERLVIQRAQRDYEVAHSPEALKLVEEVRTKLEKRKARRAPQPRPDK